jgi:hypothetical protein
MVCERYSGREHDSTTIAVVRRNSVLSASVEGGSASPPPPSPLTGAAVLTPPVGFDDGEPDTSTCDEAEGAVDGGRGATGFKPPSCFSPPPFAVADAAPDPPSSVGMLDLTTLGTEEGVEGLNDAVVEGWEWEGEGGDVRGCSRLSEVCSGRAALWM